MLKFTRTIVPLALLLSASPALAEEDAEDRGSRAAHSTDEAVEYGYHAALFEGVYMQDPRVGTMVDAGLEAGLDFGDSDVSAELQYLYEPFSTKSFNFADEDQTLIGPSVQERLVQSMHEVTVTPRYNIQWNDRLKTRNYLRLQARFPEFDTDNRLLARLKSKTRWGERRGFFAEGALEFFGKQYPNYEVSDRRLDQTGFAVSPGVGWVFEDRHEIELNYELERTVYADARYDMLDANGDVVRATESKSYLEHYITLDGTWRITPDIKARAGYEFKINDAINYDVEMTGISPNGNTDPRFMTGYYDYTRHTVEARLEADVTDDFVVEGFVEYWARDFDTYEARDVDNVWTGELRHDNAVEAGFETSYEVYEFGSDTWATPLFVTGFVSHVHRDSNMEREVSFATNYNITRAFVGLEARSR